MDSSSETSPERSPATTYMTRPKRKRTLSNQSPVSDTEASVPSSPVTMKNSPSKKPLRKVPVSKGPKLVDVSLPGPSPKRQRRDSDESVQSKKPTHVKSASSVSSLNRVLQQVADSPSIGKKHSSETSKIKKSKSKVKSVYNDGGDNDDAVSIADSTISNKVRRNEAERIQYFENQPECGKMEPHLVECLRCTKFVNLGKKQTYAVRPWEVHRSRCDQRPAVDPLVSPSTDKGKEPEIQPQSSSAAPSPLTSTAPARRLGEEDRKVALLSDKQAEKVESNQILCRKCHAWVPLSESQPYLAGNWVKHKLRCADAIPSNRVAAAKRKLLIVNDAQVKSFDESRIECEFCGVQVQLKGEGDYNLTCWEEHKVTCVKRSPTPRSESVNSIAFPSRYTRPASSASTSGNTDRTLIASDHSPSQGLKRPREEPDASLVEEERPVNKQRSEFYIPEQNEAGPFGWLLLPFQAFARGFRESLKNGSS